MTPGQHSLKNPSACNVGINVAKKLLVFEVVSFSFFLFSSLVAQGLKLAINLLNSKNVNEIFRAHINLKVLRLGMLSCGSKSAVHVVVVLVGRNQVQQSLPMKEKEGLSSFAKRWM
ncbi:hypothetical protein Adt_32529 [Abeliophyllum distichum]|uniref:Uncharacterized protein n=1 Tax=Abeliophyllum distichum TaxID=126358 RepID=A0ABD1QTS5_9LAMI